jgi:cytosine/adenosine deaminase-related metal-dependent hydrolase
MRAGSVNAWIVHLAEGVRDRDRVAGDTYSSRREFDTIRRLHLLNDATVIVHGTALEPSDFAAMRHAGPAGPRARNDGLGAKLVWSPLSNLLLYGHTTNVYDALAKGVTVSLSTDWTVSGSNNLLDELKVADIALRASSAGPGTRSRRWRATAHLIESSSTWLRAIPPGRCAGP